MCPDTPPLCRVLGFCLICQGHGLDLVHVHSVLPSYPRHLSPRCWTLPGLSLALLLPSLTGHLRAKGLSSQGQVAAAPPSEDDDRLL